MEIEIEVDTWDVDHYQKGSVIKLAYLLELLLEKLEIDIKDGRLVDIKENNE